MYAQMDNRLPILSLAERIQPAPKSVFNKFLEAGMSPVNHTLSEIEKNKVMEAFSILPPLHQKILKEHLYSISFMDNMPNTALTSPVEISKAKKMFNITFRAEIINETISEWATWKENTYYTASENNEYDVIIDGGNLDAIVYVLLHEATHIVDAVLNITPQVDDIDSSVPSTSFTADVWYKMNEPQENVTNPLLETTRFRSGKPLPMSSTPEVYKTLQKTPFASLYSMASWHEDLAELVTIYHLTKKMKQPFKIMVKKNGATVSTYEPFTNKEVIKRKRNMRMFYIL
tara:strand:- start:3131 stop:3994 length:864 start_codon:yes stop_codon:yes gene_type:complete